MTRPTLSDVWFERVASETSAVWTALRRNAYLTATDLWFGPCAGYTQALFTTIS